MVTTFYPPFNFGGDGRYVRNLASALARRGHRVDVVCDADAFHLLGDRTTGPAPEPGPVPGVTVHVLRSRVPALSCLATQQLGRRLVHGGRLRRLLDGPFDVIHFHNASLVGGPRMLAYGAGVKLYTAHDHWLVCPTHTLWRHNREVCTGRECVRCSLAYRRPPQLWRATGLIERSARHVDAFIALSRFTAAKHAEFGFSRPMTVVPSFLPDLEAADSGPRIQSGLDGTGRGTGRPYFLFVGRLETIKGLQDVIPLFDRESPADLLIAGTGAFEAELRALAGGRPTVRFLGPRPPDALHALYRDAVALIAPSAGFEVFPQVVLEAFQHGVPVIARRLGPYPEIVEASGGGLLFGTAAGLREAMTSLAADPGRRAALGQAGRRAFRERWSESVAMAGYLDLIRSIAARRGLTAISEAFAATGAARSEPPHTTETSASPPGRTGAGA